MKMNKIDTNEWKGFKIGDLFNLFLSKDDLQLNNIEEGDTPLISSGQANNGIIAYIVSDTAKLWLRNTLTVDMFGKCFYQKQDYYCVSHGRVNILQLKEQKSKRVMRFLAIIIDHKTSSLFSYTEMCTNKRLKDVVIYLPVSDEKEPDYQYMEYFMKSMEEKLMSTLGDFNLIRTRKIDTSGWKEFQLKDLFEISISQSVDKTLLDFDDSNEIDFIGRTDTNNGIQGKINKLSFEPNEAETYSVTQIGTKVCQYRENKWYASQNIFKLNPLDKEMNKAHRFMTVIITQTLKCKYSDNDYSSYPTLKKLQQQVIKLPVDADGQPDWKYMESYMKALETKTLKQITYLQQ